MCEVVKLIKISLYSIVESKYVLTYVYRFLFVYAARSAAKVEVSRPPANKKSKKHNIEIKNLLWKIQGKTLKFFCGSADKVFFQWRDSQGLLLPLLAILRNPHKWPDTEIKRLTKKKCSIYTFSYLFRSTDFVTCK